MADDSITIQKHISINLTDGDYELVTTDNPEDALNLARQMVPDLSLVLVDVDMPGMNGYEICKQIKSEPDLWRIPVILLVESTEKYDKDKAEQAGADGFITKPFESKTLLRVIEETSARSHSQVDDILI